MKNTYPIGKILSGTIQEIGKKSVNVKLDEETIAVLPISEIRHDGQELKDLFKEGDTLDVMIHHYDLSDRRIIVSQKNLERARERAEIDRLTNDSEFRVKFEDLLKDDSRDK